MLACSYRLNTCFCVFYPKPEKEKRKGEIYWENKHDSCTCVCYHHTPIYVQFSKKNVFMSRKKKKQSSDNQTVVVLGASIKPQRYSYKAVKLLLQYDHKVIPVHPKLTRLDKLAVVASLSDISTPVDTLALYVGAERSRPMIDEIIALKPGRVIFNPGTESKFLEKKLSRAGIPFVHDCTLVMLQSNQFNL